MILSATAFFIFSTYILKNLGTGLLLSSQGGVLPYLIAFGLIHTASTLWMPLVGMMISNPSTILWIGIRIALAIVTIVAIVVFILLLKISPKQSGLFYYFSLIGLLIFIIHTGVLDAMVWPYFWK
jgi:hypothetical protein